MRQIQVGAWMRRRSVQPATWIAVVTIAYWAGGELGLRLALVHQQVTPIWPPTGIAVVALWYGGRRMIPGIFLGALLVNLPLGPSPVALAVLASGNTLAPLATVSLLHFLRFRSQFDGMRDAILLVVAALVGMVVSASIGTTALWLSHVAHPGGFLGTWTVWWTGDTMGVLLLAPLLFGFVSSSLFPAASIRALLELLGLLTVSGLVTVLAFNTQFRIVDLVFPFVLLTAWRFRQLGGASSALVASVIASALAVDGNGAFTGLPLLDKMITLQAFNATLAITSFLFASALSIQARERELATLYAASQLANESKTRFLNLAAHELRTPLTVVRGYLSMITDGTLGDVPGQLQEPLNIMERKSDELSELVDNLLDAARLEGSKLQINPLMVDAGIIVSEAASRAQPRATLIGATVKAEVQESSLMMYADPHHTARILDNLLNNAMSYSGHPPTIHVHPHRSGNEVRILVEDDGAGIPMEWREAIFERFTRVDDTDLPRNPGTGLGLYIARELALLQGGSLTLMQSEPGKGSTFELRLPAHPAA